MARKKEQLEPEVVVAYKGFNKDLRCTGGDSLFQYEVGKSYEHKGDVKCCSAGFHACEYPLDVFRYYAPSESRFAVVEQSGRVARHDEDSKIASSSISIKAELDLPGIIKAAIEYTISRTKPVVGSASVDEKGHASNSGDSGAASNSGQHGIAADFNGWGKARSVAGGAIVCTKRDSATGAILAIRASKVGENGVKPDVWYSLDDEGNFVEAA